VGQVHGESIEAQPAERGQPQAITHETMGAVMLIDNGATLVPYGMVAAAGRPVDKVGPFQYVGWDELHPGGWDAKARLADMDRDGVDAIRIA